MANFGPVLLYILCLFCLVAIARCQLRPDGKNVKTKSEKYYVTEKTSVPVRKSRSTCTTTCSWRIFGACARRQRVCRTVYFYTWTTRYKKVKKTRPVYVCEDGWARKGDECTTPKCVGGCENKGVCIAPNTCQCITGWSGSRCNSDIDECKTEKNQCGHKPGCVNTKGGYTCNCPSGYVLKSDKRNCADIDECSRGQYSCGANMKCNNVPGNYSCNCLNGFELAAVGNYCKDIDECSPSSGIFHGCEMKCENYPGGYNCSCDEGFYLATDGEKCSDHDECKGNGHGCQQKCVNVPGGYHCDCLAGYRLSKEDLTSCQDINECSENISGCAHVCKNSVGGYDCSCNKGFELGNDRKSCDDIDECSKSVDYCHHICFNAFGSYRCGCRAGFDLQIDGKMCTGQPCFPVHTPLNGVMNCTGYRTEDNCHFGCLPGYNLDGSRSRTCEPGKKWTGNKTECKIIHCPSPVYPSNGFVYLPCDTRYGSECSVGCNNGYYLNTTKLITCNVEGIWEPSNISCTAIKVCQPNPCLYDGICSVVSEDQYICDCTHTGYIGKNCDIGTFAISDYPTLISNNLSPPIMVISSPPTNYVVLHFINRDLQFSPPSLTFKRNSPVNQSVKVSAPVKGFYTIRYALSGPDAKEFRLPEEQILFVNSPNITNDSSILNFPYGCYKKRFRTCPGSNASIIVSSTSPFVPFGPIFTTEGIVSVEGENLLKIPFSLLGINLPISTTSPLADSCNENEAKPFPIQSLVKFRSLAKSFTEVTRESLPSWLHISLRKKNFNNNIQSSELKTRFLVGKQIRDSGVGIGLPVNNNMYYSLLATNKINITIENDVDILQSNSLSMAVEICGKSPANILLRPNTKENFNPISNISALIKIRKYGWSVNVSSVQFSNAKRIRRAKKEGLWDGYKYFSVDASSDGTFALVSSIRKDFINSTFGDIRMEFDGTIIADFQDVNQILTFPLNQYWHVDLYGRLDLTVSFQIQGKYEKIIFDGSEGSVGYAGFGGLITKDAPDRKRGIFFRTTMKKNPFLNSSLKNFVDINLNERLSCFLNTTIYREKHSSQHVELTDKLSCVFRGILKVGDARFHPMEINLQMASSSGIHFMRNNVNKSEDNAVELTGSYIDLSNQTFGIFKHSPENCVNVQLTLATRTPTFMGSYCATLNIFGIKKLVNVTFTHEGIQFQVSGKLYDRFNAAIHCSSKLLPWENQIFDVFGRFITNTEGNNLPALLKKEVDVYGLNILLQAKKRVKAVDLTINRAAARLENVRLLRKQASNKLEELIGEYTSIKENIEAARKYLDSLELKAANVSEKVEKLRLDLDNLCSTKQCSKLCEEGVSCTPCYEDIIANTLGTCPATCSKTEQRQIPPYTEVADCKSENCKRIHNTNGFFKSVFRENHVKIVKGAVSLGITVVASFFVPPTAAAAIGGGITTLVDTGRLDEAICSAATAAAAATLSNSVKQKYLKHVDEIIDKKAESVLVKFGAKVVFGNLVKCQREQRDGSWKCSVETVKCTKERYEYEYHHVPYICKKSCVIQKITKTVEKSCCSNVSCALFVVNVTCVAENVLCKTARSDALAKISKTKSQAGNVLRDLEDGRSNLSYWNMRGQKYESMLQRQRRWLNTTEKTIRSLQRAYNSTLRSKMEINNILNGPIRVIKSLLNEKQTSFEAINVTDIHFKTKVSAKSNNNHLLPIDVTMQINKTVKEISTVLDFERLNASLKSISQEIISDVIGKFSSTSRKKRSVETSRIETDTLLSSLKKFHTYCAKFTNYHQILFNVATSLYNLSSEVLRLEESIFQDRLMFNSSKVLPAIIPMLNQTMVSHFGLAKDNYSHIEHFINDPELSEAIELQKEATRQNYQELNSTARLVVYNWWATMEDTFNSSRFAYECSGMNDCIAYILDTLVKMSSLIGIDGIENIRQQVDTIERALEDLSHPKNVTVDRAVKVSSGILTVLREMVELKLLCAQAPNITRHPKPITELSIGEDLVLQCNASGTGLEYSWTFNGDVLEGQKSNVMVITNATEDYTGNYTCLVSNHIAKEKSIPAVVIIHPPPIIITQPVAYLAIVLSEEDFLNCAIDDTGRNISYQWWFKAANMSSFIALPNETFSYLDFSPMKAEYEGMYFCQVSDSYGTTSSRVSFVKAVSFTLPVPVAVVSFSLHEVEDQANSSKDSLNFNGYDAISSNVLQHILSDENSGDGVLVENLQPTSCQLDSVKKNGIGTCSWEFQYVGRNTTSNFTIYNDFIVNAGMVINATREVSETIGRFVNATNNGSLSFSFAGNTYLTERNSIAVRKFVLTCPRTQALVKEDFKCVDCPPGYHAVLDEEERTTCEPCPLGSYQTEPAKVTCKQCPKGYSTSHIGSYDRAQCKAVCKAGQYGTIVAETLNCVLCPRNTYQPQEGQFGCKPCPSNHITQLEGATKLEQCHLVAETTKSSAKTTSTTRRTTKALFIESDTDENLRGLIIGLPVGVIIVIATVIAVMLIVRYRRSAEYKTRSQKKLQTPEQPTNGIDDAGNGTFVCSFENAIYDGGLGGGEIVSSRANDLDDSETDGDNAKQAKGIAYNNPAFAQISSE